MKVYLAIPMLKVTWNTIAHVAFVYLNIFLAFQQHIMEIFEKGHLLFYHNQVVTSNGMAILLAFSKECRCYWMFVGKYGP
jgi:hypothetical protein